MDRGASGSTVLNDAVGDGQALRIGGRDVACHSGRRNTHHIQSQIKIGSGGVQGIDGQTQTVAGEP